jgi:arylsulfatase A-like enzyme
MKSIFRFPLNAIAIALGTLFCNSVVYSQPNNRKPNIIILFADDMRAGTIHALGNPEIITPNLDQLVKNGTSFPHAYNMGGHTGAVCVSSRAMLMTGQSIHHLGNTKTEIPEEHILLGTVFQSQGYQTYGIGKWHNGIASYAQNFKDGSEIMFGGMTSSQWEIPLNHFNPDGSYEQAYTPADPKNRDLPVISDHVYKGKHSAEIFAGAAVNFLGSEKSKKPFFLYVAFTTPHDPRQMPKAYMDKYDVKKISLPANFLPEHPFDNGHMQGRDEKLLSFPRKPENVKSEIRDYYATITHLDAQVGRIVAALKKSGQYENTIIIFAGDNGLAIGQHGLMGKQNLYEHTVGVPMIWSGAGIPKNKKSNAYCYLTDIYPTLCDIIGIPKPATVDGISFLSNLKGAVQSPHGKMYYAFRDLQRAVRDGRYKLIEYNVKGFRTTQLFNLETDPLEMVNLAPKEEFHSVVDRLRSDLLKHKETSGDNQNPFWTGF